MMLADEGRTSRRERDPPRRSADSGWYSQGEALELVARTLGLYFVEPRIGHYYHRKPESESTPMEDSGDEGPASRYEMIYGQLVRYRPPRVTTRWPDPPVASETPEKMEVDLSPPAAGGARPKVRAQGKSAATPASKTAAPSERPRRDDSVDEVARVLSRTIRSGEKALYRDDTGGWGLIPVEKTGATAAVYRPPAAAQPDHRSRPDTTKPEPQPATSGWKAPTASALATASGKAEAKKEKSQADKQRT